MIQKQRGMLLTYKGTPTCLKELLRKWVPFFSGPSPPILHTQHLFVSAYVPCTEMSGLLRIQNKQGTAK